MISQITYTESRVSHGYHLILVRTYIRNVNTYPATRGGDLHLLSQEQLRLFQSVFQHDVVWVWRRRTVDEILEHEAVTLHARDWTM